MWKSCLCLLFGFWCVNIVVGCGSGGPQRAIVSGSVTYQGEPIKQGKIIFFPLEGTNAPSAAAAIVDGKYCVDRKGGAIVGEYTVKITAYRANPGAFSPGASGAQAGPPDREMPQQFLPDKFNRRTELKITIPSDSGEITQDFELK